MSTYTQIYYHIVFSTKHRVPALARERRDELYGYIWGVLKNKYCQLFRIGGVEDHLHLALTLHPAIALADLIKDMKVASQKWIKTNGVFGDFEGWQDGYAAFTFTHTEKDKIIEYVKLQEEHHRKEDWREELKDLLKKAEVKFEEKYLA